MIICRSIRVAADGIISFFLMAEEYSEFIYIYIYIYVCVYDFKRNAGLNELQVGIKIGGNNTNNLIYVDDTTLMAESEEEPLDEGEGGE